VRKQLAGSWNGWSGDTVVKLTDGTFLKQARYHYEYRYAYRPYAEFDGATLHVEGMSRPIPVRRVYPHESSVKGAWTGWSGQTVLELADGTQWQQMEYHYEYQYAYSPDVTIVDDMMYVDGMSKSVRVRRIY
jgi:hypothetical protein